MNGLRLIDKDLASIFFFATVRVVRKQLVTGGSEMHDSAVQRERQKNVITKSVNYSDNVTSFKLTSN